MTPFTERNAASVLYASPELCQPSTFSVSVVSAARPAVASPRKSKAARMVRFTLHLLRFY
ncbi:MAG: hypothetical protein ACJ79O_02245 [Myxococcales bacterium]